MTEKNVHLQMAKDALKRNDIILASVEATKAIEMDADCYEAYIIRGQISMAFGDKKGAADDFKRALEINPELQEQLNGKYSM